MTKLTVILLIVSVTLISACSDVKRSPGRDYMPDMRYSRAYETYSEHGNLNQKGINYTGMPVAGTVKRGEAFPFSIPKDQEGDSTNYIASRQVVNPLPMPDTVQMKEVERLYLINCGICHGPNLDGNGPLYNNGTGPYPAAPRNLVADPKVTTMPEGQIFYSVTYGKGVMGPYGPQLTTSQRWMIVHYIKSKQAQSKPGSAATGGDSTGGKPASIPAANAAGSSGKPAGTTTKPNM